MALKHRTSVPIASEVYTSNWGDLQTAQHKQTSQPNPLQPGQVQIPYHWQRHEKNRQIRDNPGNWRYNGE